ncbi:hypothetical protein [uncultured Roseobacter sp.]|uniref:hypothetical protein n=1 Tax=uncultured Roseobacter sp. TaxID=114847 RepID=UPI00263003DC|nr:hypothetical protein [uncultured Roseobacter sp.]
MSLEQLKEKELDKAIRIATKQAEFNRIKRASSIEAINDLVAFATKKITAFSLVGLGGLEILAPHILNTIEMGESASAAAVAVGLGMLGGKHLAEALRRFTDGG